MTCFSFYRNRGKLGVLFSVSFYYVDVFIDPIKEEIRIGNNDYQQVGDLENLQVVTDNKTLTKLHLLRLCQILMTVTKQKHS